MAVQGRANGAQAVGEDYTEGHGGSRAEDVPRRAKVASALQLQSQAAGLIAGGFPPPWNNGDLVAAPPRERRARRKGDKSNSGYARAP